MDSKFFNREKNDNAEEFKKFLPANVQFSYDSINPALVNVEEVFIKKLLSKELFVKLGKYYEDSISNLEGFEQSSKMDKLLELVQSCAIKLAYWKEYPSLAVSVTDTGAKAGVDKDQRLFKYEYDDLLTKLKNDGFNQMDIVINYLLENIGNFVEFKASVCYPQFDKTFIPTTEIFDGVYNINGSRLVFLKMRQYIDYVEDIELDLHIGSEFKEEILKNYEAPKYKKVVNWIRKYVVNLSVATGSSEVGKNLTDRGLIFESFEDGVKRSQVVDKELYRSIEKNKVIADKYMTKCLLYLKQNISEYPLFAEHIGITKDVDNIVRRNNDNKKTFFI